MKASAIPHVRARVNRMLLPDLPESGYSANVRG
jgi:hypothetical protein